jgi:hypothetical protein
MQKTVAVAIFALTFSLMACAPDSPPAPRKAQPPTRIPNEAAFLKTIEVYVQRTRGWRKNIYAVSLDHRDGKLFVFAVNNKNENPVVGGGLSFEVQLDPNTNRVVRELHYQ